MADARSRTPSRGARVGRVVSHGPVLTDPAQLRLQRGTARLP